MGEIRAEAPRALLFFAAFSSRARLLDMAPEILSEEFGPVVRSSPRFSFTETTYYARDMGENLEKQFFVCGGLRSVDRLPEFKRRANDIEARIASSEDWGVPRPINFDPGLIDEAKLILASTKDHAHRLYLGGGIFGEITLQYRGKEWLPMPWTYPDYRREDVRAFFLTARELFRQVAMEARS